MLTDQLVVPNQVKLVVWDLDDTLWRGTISEGPVSYFPGRADLVRELNRRGILNSICSKNDPAVVRERLEADGLWSEFVFSSINWQPKGQRLAQLIDDMQLRAVNVLFLDDNSLNLQEAAHYVPGLMTALPDAAESLLSHPNAKGKPDPGLKRLRQYQLLEQKAHDRNNAAESSNEEFLASCDIRVYLGQDCRQHADRLVDLLNRSNQLNFTKRRFTEEEFEALLDEPDRQTGYVQVSDKYGDYGITGVYSVKAGRLDDFTFSCRTMNMGIEQWVYNQLGRPQLETVGEVASTLEATDVPWITGVASSQETESELPATPVTSRSPILLKGGCDLGPVHDFLGGRFKTEFSYNGLTGANVQGHHTEILLRCSQETLDSHGEVIDRLPFVDRDVYKSQMVLAPSSFRAVVYSVLMDYTQGLYRLKGSDFVVPQGEFTEDITDPGVWPIIEQMYGPVGLDRAFLTWFSENFEYLGPLSPEQLANNLRRLVSRLPSGCKLVLINGAEVAIDNPREPMRHERHRQMNAALDALAVEIPEILICDVRPFVRTREDVTDNIRHYPRRVFIDIANALGELLGEDIDIDTRPVIYQSRRIARRIVRGGGRRIRRIVRNSAGG